MNINEVNTGVVKKKRPKRVGRGTGSGKGKTSSRGHKGQRSRSGASSSVAFEGGRMSTFRRIPKRGFHNRSAIKVFAINIGDLASRFEDGDKVTPETLREVGLLKGPFDELKILGDGELYKRLHISAHRFSGTAREKITKAGGKFEILSGPRPVVKNKQRPRDQRRVAESGTPGVGPKKSSNSGSRHKGDALDFMAMDCSIDDRYDPKYGCRITPSKSTESLGHYGVLIESNDCWIQASPRHFLLSIEFGCKREAMECRYERLMSLRRTLFDIVADPEQLNAKISLSRRIDPVTAAIEDQTGTPDTSLAEFHGIGEDDPGFRKLLPETASSRNSTLCLSTRLGDVQISQRTSQRDLACATLWFTDFVEPLSCEFIFNFHDWGGNAKMKILVKRELSDIMKRSDKFLHDFSRQWSAETADESGKSLPTSENASESSSAR